MCGFYLFAHTDWRITSNPAQYGRRPQMHPSKAAVSTAPSSASPNGARATGLDLSLIAG